MPPCSHVSYHPPICDKSSEDIFPLRTQSGKDKLPQSFVIGVTFKIHSILRLGLLMPQLSQNLFPALLVLLFVRLAQDLKLKATIYSDWKSPHLFYPTAAHLCIYHSYHFGFQMFSCFWYLKICEFSVYDIYPVFPGVYNERVFIIYSIVFQQIFFNNGNLLLHCKYVKYVSH